MIRIYHKKGNFKKTTSFLQNASKMPWANVLDEYGKKGVQLLSEATPKKTGKTALSWAYEIEKNENGYFIYWKNTNINNGVNIAIILQYGHGTGTGGYVQGVDYINPALRPLFEELANNAWEEVISK